MRATSSRFLDESDHKLYLLRNSLWNTKMVLFCRISLSGATGLIFFTYLCCIVHSTPVSPALCPQKNIPHNEVQPWPNNIISFTLSDNLTNDARSEILQVLAEWEKQKCDRIVFVPHHFNAPGAGHFVSFVPGERCCSSRGKTGTQSQEVYINESCTGRNLKNIVETLIGEMTEGESHIQHNTSSPRTSTMGESGDAENPQNTSTHECQNSNVKRITGKLNGKDKHGNILSPNYPMEYNSNTEYIWKISVPNNAVLRLNFLDFLTENEDDYLEIHFINSTTGSIQSLDCVSGISRQIISSNLSVDIIIMKFHSDVTHNFQGFNISYEFLENRHNCEENNGGCSHKCITDSSGIGYCNCDPGYEANKSGNCRDTNECRIGTHGCSHNCRNTPGSYDCDCNEGYAIHIDKHYCERCLEEYNSTKGTIYSAGHPGRYPDYQNCLYKIHIHPNHVLKLTISVVDIINTTDCKREFLKMEHGYFRYNRRLCSYLSNISYYIKDESVTSTTLRFRTRNLNRGNNYGGFSVRYQQYLRSTVPDTILDTVHVGSTTKQYNDRPWLLDY